MRRTTEPKGEKLQEQFGLTEIQAQAILDLRLRRLSGLARKEIEGEFADLQERIVELRAILGDEARIDSLIRDELLEIKEIYAKSDERRTEIVAGEDSLELEDMIAEEDMVIAITRSGYIKRLPVTAYREQRRGGIGVMGMDLKDEDFIEHLFVASTHDYILFFTTVGKVYRLKVHELPLGSRQSKGRAIVNLLPFRQGEQVRAVIATRNFEEAKYLLFATQEGHRQEDAVPRVQHAAQGGRHHRDQAAGGRRAHRCAALGRLGGRAHGLTWGAGDPLPRDRRALHGPACLRRAGHALAR